MHSSLYAAVVAVCVRVFRKRRYRGFLGMVTGFNIVYNTVINFIGGWVPQGCYSQSVVAGARR
jgi:hypothetical protein